MAPLVTPSWSSSAAMDRSISRVPPALLRQHPVAVVDADHHAGAIVEPIVVLRGHDEHPVARDDVGGLERVAQAGTELTRTGLALLQRLGDRLGEQRIGIPRVP